MSYYYLSWMNEITRRSDVKAVSFSANNRITPQIKLVIALIKQSIERNKPISKEDIINTYCDYREMHPYAPHRRLPIFYKEEWKYSNNSRIVSYKEISRAEYATTYTARLNAMQWFKGNLAAAIIKGKLLVIPIIEIE